MPTRQRARSSSGGGLTVKTFTGLNKKRIESSGGGNTSYGQRVSLKAGNTIPLQFYGTPDPNGSGFTEFEQHGWKEDGRWTFVPCVGDACPLCDDESQDRSKTSYRFIAQVYNLKEKKPQILEGPRDLASRIFYRYERNPARFLKRMFEVTRFDGTPAKYDVATGDEDLVDLRRVTPLNLDDYLKLQIKAYYGDSIPTKSSLDADDDLDDDADDLEDDTTTEDAVDADELRDELEELNDRQLKARAKANGAKSADVRGDTDALIELILSQEVPGYESDDSADDDDDDDDDDLDDDDDEDDDDEDEDEDEPPARPTRAAARKAPAKKAAGTRRR